VNPFDPTDDELRQWALGDGRWPVQDFDLMVAEHNRLPVLLELTSSPQREFFLRCLYLIVGDAVRSNFNTTMRSDLEDALDRAELALRDPAIDRWVSDSRALIAHPETFTYDDWCDGGLARLAARPPGR
jgi:hypothetical protein